MISDILKLDVTLRRNVIFLEVQFKDTRTNPKETKKNRLQGDTKPSLSQTGHELWRESVHSQLILDVLGVRTSCCGINEWENELPEPELHKVGGHC